VTIYTLCVVGDDGWMELRRRSLRFVAIAVVLSLPLLGTSGVASAKAKAVKGCHKTHTCKSGGGASTGSGTGADPAPITVQIDPNPLVETSESIIVATIQVETSPSFAGDAVNVSSSQLSASCDGGVEFFTITGTPTLTGATITLDDDGNATLMVFGYDCAPGSDVVEADLDVAPYYTALGTLVASPPVVTTPGVYGYPTTSGTVTTGEVETGDTAAPGDSDVYAVFYVETNPVYAEQYVEIGSPELESRCGDGWEIFPLTTGTPSTGGGVQPPATGVLDDDGNVAFVFVGASCAAGPSDVIADVLAGTHPTYTTSFNIVAPQPTI
jgi:hypothetical protein